MKGLTEKLKQWMDEEDIKEQESMKNHTTFRVGGPARLFLSIRSKEILSKVITCLKAEGQSYFLLGNGSNLLVSDKGYSGVILYLDKEFSYITVDENKIAAGASALLSKIANKAMEKGLSGLEFAAGIPGTIGGGTVMNAGAYGGELAHVICRVEAMDQEGKIHILEKDQLNFGYRNSIFKEKPYIILEVTMELIPGRREKIFEKMKEYQRARREKQPLEYPSAGSTFKRPVDNFAGKLIMEAGLRGFQIGGAKVSEKHCGFVINTGNATATDITMLMEKVQETVMKKFGIELEPEVIRLEE